MPKPMICLFAALRKYLELFRPCLPSPPNTHTHVLVDSWCHCRRVRRAAARRGWDLSGGLKSNRWMRISTPEKGLEWVLLSTYAASLEAADWVEATWPAQEGGPKVYVQAVRTWVRKPGPTLVLIIRYSLDQPLTQSPGLA